VALLISDCHPRDIYVHAVHVQVVYLHAHASRRRDAVGNLHERTLLKRHHLLFFVKRSERLVLFRAKRKPGPKTR